MIQCYQKYTHGDYWICLMDLVPIPGLSSEEPKQHRESWVVYNKFQLPVYASRRPQDAAQECERFIDHISSGQHSSDFDPYADPPSDTMLA